jgi:hypothetical protein
MVDAIRSSAFWKRTHYLIRPTCTWGFNRERGYFVSDKLDEGSYRTKTVKSFHRLFTDLSKGSLTTRLTLIHASWSLQMSHTGLRDNWQVYLVSSTLTPHLYLERVNKIEKLISVSIWVTNVSLATKVCSAAHACPVLDFCTLH